MFVCRLYSSAVFKNNFEEHAAAEITRRPVDDLVLQMKVSGWVHADRSLWWSLVCQHRKILWDFYTGIGK